MIPSVKGCTFCQRLVWCQTPLLIANFKSVNNGTLSKINCFFILLVIWILWSVWNILHYFCVISLGSTLSVFTFPFYTHAQMRLMSRYFLLHSVFHSPIYLSALSFTFLLLPPTFFLSDPFRRPLSGPNKSPQICLASMRVLVNLVGNHGKYSLRYN